MNAMRAKKTQTEIRKDQIARAALKVVERHGLHGLNVARVARSVGIVPSALYRHFPGKDEVLESVLELIAGRIEANVALARANRCNALERLHELLTRHVELIRRNSAIPRVVFSEEMLHGRARHRRRMHEVIQAYLRHVEELICDGQREGCVRAGVDAKTASFLFLGLIQPSVVLWAMSDGGFDVSAHAEAGWKLYVQVIKQEPRFASPRNQTRKE